MADQLLKIATLFRVTAAELRRLAKGPIQTERDTIVAVEAYLHRNQARTAPTVCRYQGLDGAYRGHRPGRGACDCRSRAQADDRRGPSLRRLHRAIDRRRHLWPRECRHS